MRHGLGQTDLNLKAQLALAGFSPTPDADIAALLMSSQPIERQTRRKLADALRGRSDGIHLEVTNRSAGKVVRAIQLRRAHLQRGKEHLDKGKPEGNHSSGKFVSEKTLGAAITLANKTWDWVSKVRSTTSDYDHLTDESLEIVFLLADATGRLPDECLKASADILPQIFDWLDGGLGVKL